MKKLIAIFTLVISTVMFSSPSYAEWTKIASNIAGDDYYVDLTRIRENDGDIYFWEMTNYLKPTKNGRLSSLIYKQANCALFRDKFLTDSYFDTPMAVGTAASGSKEPDKDWTYPQPGSVSEAVLQEICNELN